MHIKTLLTRPAITTGPCTSLHDAYALMRRHGVRHLPVVEHGRLVGMLAERDIARARASTMPELARHDWTAVLEELTVADAMTRHPLTLHPETSVAAAARLAHDRHVEAFPVVVEPDVAGVITRGDLLAVLTGLLDHRRPARLGHVLAATSLRGGERVLGEALRIAEATGATVTALHVRPARSGVQRLEGATAKDVADVERARRHIADEVDAVCRREPQRAREVQGEVTDGPIAREIVRRAEELDTDLIVMGAAGGRGPLLGLLEPLAARVARLASCPVLTVPQREALHASR